MKRLLNIRDATKELNILRSLDSYKKPFRASRDVPAHRRRPPAGGDGEHQGRPRRDARGRNGGRPRGCPCQRAEEVAGLHFSLHRAIKLVDFSSRIHDTKAGTSARWRYRSSLPTGRRSGASRPHPRTSTWRLFWPSSTGSSMPYGCKRRTIDACLIERSRPIPSFRH